MTTSADTRQEREMCTCTGQPVLCPRCPAHHPSSPPPTPPLGCRHAPPSSPGPTPQPFEAEDSREPWGPGPLLLVSRTNRHGQRTLSFDCLHFPTLSQRCPGPEQRRRARGCPPVHPPPPRAPGVRRSRIRWFTRSCVSHDVSQLAALFIDA